MGRNMKHKDFKPCQICGEGMMHSGIPFFLRVTVGVDAKAVERAHGMGTDSDLATVIDGKENLLICGGCASNPLPPYFWLTDDEV